MNYNDFMKFILRTPLHGLFSKTAMLITVTGRKTGQKITLPVSYDEVGDTLWVMSRRQRTWWRNLQGGADVTLHLRGQEITGHADVMLDDEAVRAQLKDYLTRYPRLAKYMKIETTDGELDHESIEREVQDRMFVKIKVES